MEQEKGSVRASRDDWVTTYLPSDSSGPGSTSPHTQHRLPDGTYGPETPEQKTARLERERKGDTARMARWRKKGPERAKRQTREAMRRYRARRKAYGTIDQGKARENDK